MPADLPSLDRLTRDVVDAMHAAEQRSPHGAARPRWWRRMPPLALALLALSVPGGIVLHATTADDAGGHASAPGQTELRAVQACGATAATAVLLARAGRTLAAPSRTAGSPTRAIALRPCA